MKLVSYLKFLLLYLVLAKMSCGCAAALLTTGAIVGAASYKGQQDRIKETPQASKTPPQSASKKISMGTAFPLTSGYVVTNAHVVFEHEKIFLIRSDGLKIPATIATQDRSNDIVLLRVRDVDKLPSLLTVSFKSCNLGAKVFTIGYPHPDVMGAKPKLTDGIISATSGIRDDPRVYQISVPVQAGNSGGPLLNMKGDVVGVVTSTLSPLNLLIKTGDLPQNVNYAVKIQYVSALLQSLPPLKNDPGIKFQEETSLEELASHIKNSVMIVVAE